MSVAPKIQQMVLEANPEQIDKINILVDQNVIDRLMTMPEFAKAYNEDGMTPDEFITFRPVNRTATQFIASGWSLLVIFGQLIHIQKQKPQDAGSCGFGVIVYSSILLYLGK